MQISVFGLGYVGAVSCACLSELGHRVIGVDVSQAKVDLINRGQSPIVEHELPERLKAAVDSGTLSATVEAHEAVRQSEVALVCVGTPSTPSGGVEAKHLYNVADQIGRTLRDSDQGLFVVMVRSTSLPPIHEEMQRRLIDASGRTMGETMGYVCHPEFLREGVAIQDFYEPPKIVFGATGEKTVEVCRQLYPGIEAPTVFVKPEVAAMIKYADNCFHVAKVTFGNEIGMICHQLGVDSHDVMDVFCQDTKLNISTCYLKPGFAYGGSCLPKDLRALLDASRQTASPLPMLQGALESNRIQIDALLSRIISPHRPTVGIVGLAFKEGIDDIRESPTVNVVETLCGKGYRIRIYDKHLAVDSLVGANRAFALQAIPHLAELLTDDLAGLVRFSDIVVVTHRLTSEIWKNITFKPNQRIIDLVNIPDLKDSDNYEGLYW